MFLLLSPLLQGCAPPTGTSPSGQGSDSATGGSPGGGPGGTEVYEYEDEGMACISAPSSGTPSIRVDFYDCLFCSTNRVYCEATVTGDRIEVHGWGTVLVEDCPYRSTCEPVWAQCSLPELEPGLWTLSYAGFEVEVELPTREEVCTDPSSAL